MAAMSPIVAMPRVIRASSVVAPTPHRAPTGSGWRKFRVSDAGITSTPSGFARPDASFATNFTDAAPTEQRSPVSSNTRRRMCVAIASGSPKIPRAPATSRKASSIPSLSTIGVTSSKISITTRE